MRSPGTWVSKWWWEQKRLNLEGKHAVTEAADEGKPEDSEGEV